MIRGFLVAHRRIIFIFLLSCILQAIFILSYRNMLHPIQSDGKEYHLLALNLLEKHAYIGYIYEDDINVRRPPGYPFFIALIYKIFGKDVINIQFIQTILIGLTCVMVYLLGLRFSDENTAFKIGIISAGNPILVALSFYVASESLVVFCIILILYLITILIKRMTLFSCMLLGSLIGITTLIRPTVIFLPFVIAFMILVLNRNARTLKFIFAVFLPSFIIVSAWIARNYITTGYFVPISLGGDIELWNGSFLPGGGFSDHPESNKRRAELYEEFRARIKENKQPEHFDYIIEQKMFRREALKNIMRNPLGYTSLIPKKILRLYIGSFSFLYNIDKSFIDLLKENILEDKEKILIFILKIIILINSVLTFLFCLIGVYYNYKNKLFLPIILFLVYWTGINVIFSPITRFSIPILPIMLLSAVLGAVGKKNKYAVRIT